MTTHEQPASGSSVYEAVDALAAEREHLIHGIADTLQRVYGNATQTVLDRRAAAEVLSFCLQAGMTPPSMVAAIVAAAGGRVEIPDDLLMEPMRLFRGSDPVLTLVAKKA